MSVNNSEDLNKDNHDSVQEDDSYEVAYDDADSSDQVSDEWSDDEQTDIEENSHQDPPKKKKSKSTLFIVLGVVFLAIIGFVFLSGGDATQNTQQVAETSTVNTDAVATSVQPADQTQSGEPNMVENQVKPEVVVQPVVEQSGIMDDQAVVEKVENATATEPDLIPTVSDQPLDPSVNASQEINTSQEVPPVTQEIDNSLVDIVTPDIKSVSDFPTVDTIKKPETLKSEETPVIESVKESTEVGVLVAENGANVVAVQNKLNTAELRISDLEKSIVEKDEELSKSNSETDQEIQSLKAKISELEKKISESMQANEDVSASEAKPIKDVRIIQDTSSEPSETAIVAKAKVIKPKPVWTLKSANSTKAIIYNKASGDSKTISVGDYIDGLGRILSISENNSLWVVKASKASVSE